MTNLVPGHLYELENFVDKLHTGQALQFIHKEADFDDASVLRTVSDGTTNEEVLKVLIDRMEFLQKKFPCKANAMVITKLEESLMWLNKRTADRVERDVEGSHKA